MAGDQFPEAARFYRRHAVAILLIAAYLVMRTLLLILSVADSKEISPPVVKNTKPVENPGHRRNPS
jgi:hypothetical protein